MTEQQLDAMKQALEALECNRRSHYYCEDTWYSCPKHEEGCANEAEGDECNCGADEANKTINAAITALRIAIEEAEKQEPVAVHQYRVPRCSDWYDGIPDHHDGHGPYEIRTLYTTPPAAQPEPVQDIGVEQDERVFARIAARKNRDAAYKETAQRQWVGSGRLDTNRPLYDGRDPLLREKNGGQA
jgi:hypothetical protein